MLEPIAAEMLTPNVGAVHWLDMLQNEDKMLQPSRKKYLTHCAVYAVASMPDETHCAQRLTFNEHMDAFMPQSCERECDHCLLTRPHS